MQRFLRTTFLWCALSRGEAVEADACEGDVDSQVCLLQGKAFMERVAQNTMGIPSHVSHAVKECPGAPIAKNAQIGKCAYEGVTISVDGDAITDFFGDNVDMKDFHWYLNGDKQVWLNLESHPFQVGKSVVTVEGRDLAGNINHCTKLVTVTDAEKPKWTVDPSSVDSEITLPVNDKCELSAISAFMKYEEMGWTVSGTDNCGVEGFKREVWKGGEMLFTDGEEEWGGQLLQGPGKYELRYVMTDVNGLVVRHTAELDLKDETVPTEIQDCPKDIFVEIGANETEGKANWTMPKIAKDNCINYGTLPLAAASNGLTPAADTPTQQTATFPVGAHPIHYKLEDSFGNTYPEECTFTVEVKQKAHPVVITCPADVTVHTLPNAAFGVPCWEPPTAMQGPKQLDASHITFPEGVYPGLPFPYGTTVVTVKATGEITGTRTEEEDQSDECTFKVTVHDPQRPDVDGRHFRCSETTDASAKLVEPYGVCDGTDIVASFHEGYEDTGGYDLTGVAAKSGLGCCADEHGHTGYECKASGHSTYFKYCQPATAPVESVEACDAGPWAPKPAAPEKAQISETTTPLPTLTIAPDPVPLTVAPPVPQKAVKPVEPAAEPAAEAATEAAEPPAPEEAAEPAAEPAAEEAPAAEPAAESAAEEAPAAEPAAEPAA